MRKILIDCDPGIDDTIALMLAHSSQSVEIVGLTTCFGNNDCDITTRNTLDIASAIGLQTDIAKGAQKPIVTDLLTYSQFHGANGVGGAIFPLSKQEVIAKPAWEFIYEIAQKYKGELVLVTLGPLTNIAIALLRYEDLAGLLSEIIIMGGSATAGNSLPYGEANVVCDPYACKVVLQAGVPVTMVGLDATEQTRLTNEEFDGIFGRENRLSQILETMTTHYKAVQNNSGEPGLVIHDAAAVVVALNPSIAKFLRTNIAVELVASSGHYARTVVDKRKSASGKGNLQMVTQINKTEYIKMLHSMMDFYK